MLMRVNAVEIAVKPIVLIAHGENAALLNFALSLKKTNVTNRG